MESRRRVKEQQKRVGAMEFRNTHFSYTMGEDGIEQFVTTPELQSPDEIGADPLPPGQVWAISPGGEGENPGLFRIEVTVGPGSGVRDPQPAHAGAIPREHPHRGAEPAHARHVSSSATAILAQHEFNVQLRAFDAARSGAEPRPAGACSRSRARSLERSLRGGLIAIGGLNLGGGIETVANAVAVAELAAEKGAVDAARPDLRPPPAQRAERRHRDEGQRPVLRRLARGLGKGAR